MKSLALVASVISLAPSCTERHADSDVVQQRQQETLLREATAQVGMPVIKNFREKKMLKDILELRDQDGLVTYTYLWSPQQGKLVFFCDSIGYGFPAATQYTSPQKVRDFGGSTYAFLAVPQADPNDLFSPASAEGTWIVCKDPNGPATKPVYVEERITVTPFRMEKSLEK